jgi:hypothetical protein
MIGSGSDSTEEKANEVRFEDLAVTGINTAFFWDAVPCSKADRYEYLEKRAYLGLSTSLQSFSSQTTVTY